MEAVTDGRQQGRIPTRVIVRAVVAMFLSRLGSLNALEQSRPSRFWRRWLGRLMPSADTIGRVCAGIDVAGLRALLRQVYTRLKRLKALPPPGHGLMAAVLDGHESHATYKRRCDGCHQRVIRTRNGDRVQYYHRHVSIQLVGAGPPVMLDAEPIAPGEDEVAAGLRLLERTLATYPRAFDVIVGDALYATTAMVNAVLDHGKHMVAVLKDNHPDLLADVGGLLDQVAPVSVPWKNRSCQCWDIDGFTSWPGLQRPVRVVRSVETWSVRRQLDNARQEQHAEWMWVTTLPAERASTEAVLDMGHGRWTIENQGFNELVNGWHADHVYKHEPTAILAFWLLAMLCLNVFLAFYRRDLKPAARRAASMRHVARQIAADLYAAIPSGQPAAPT